MHAIKIKKDNSIANKEYILEKQAKCDAEIEDL